MREWIYFHTYVQGVSGTQIRKYVMTRTKINDAPGHITDTSATNGPLQMNLLILKKTSLGSIINQLPDGIINRMFGVSGNVFVSADIYWLGHTGSC